jgi:hypothetical protein
VSHLKERKEKNCLNCNAQLQGRYCNICGQENVEPKESAWHLVNHFFQDITHFDGKFFTTLWLLISRPGFLSAEYARGRRASYLNPIRMYVFSSALFFLIFFSFFKVDDNTINNNASIKGKTLKQISQMDTAAFNKFTQEINKEAFGNNTPMTRERFKVYFDSALADMNPGFQFSGTKYQSLAEYDSLVNIGVVKDGWVKHVFQRRQLQIKAKYKGHSGEMTKILIDVFLHKLPQMMFISLPLLALLLKLLYIRRKAFYYVNHGIFSIHLYIYVFIALLISFGLNKIHDKTGWLIFDVLKVFVNFSIFFYLYKALKNFYQQGRIKTISKYLILLLSFTFLVAILFVIFLFLSVFSI